MYYDTVYTYIILYNMKICPLPNAYSCLWGMSPSARLRRAPASLSASHRQKRWISIGQRNEKEESPNNVRYKSSNMQYGNMHQYVQRTKSDCETMEWSIFLNKMLLQTQTTCYAFGNLCIIQKYVYIHRFHIYRNENCAYKYLEPVSLLLCTGAWEQMNRKESFSIRKRKRPRQGEKLQQRRPTFSKSHLRETKGQWTYSIVCDPEPILYKQSSFKCMPLQQNWPFLPALPTPLAASPLRQLPGKKKLDSETFKHVIKGHSVLSLGQHWTSMQCRVPNLEETKILIPWEHPVLGKQ